MDGSSLATSTLFLSKRTSEDLLAREGSSHQGWRPSLSEVVGEIRLFNSIALPVIITGLLVYGKSVVSILFMGGLGKEALAGGSLASGIANITGYSVISGLASGMEAISSQAYGAKQWTLMFQALPRTIAILLTFLVPISLLWLNIEPILVFFHLHPTISSIASTYLLYSLPALLFQSFINPIKIYLRTKNITLPLMLSAIFSLALHAPINYVLAYHLGLGIRGVALAAAVADFNLLLALWFYMHFYDMHLKTGQCFSLDLFRGWKPIFRLAIPSCMLVCLEWWWYELMIILSGLLPNASEAIATMGILLQVTALVYIFPSALSSAVSTRVGNELGANSPRRARISSQIALAFAVFVSVIAMLFTTMLRNAWGRAFTTDEAILSLTSMAMPVVGLCELGNCPQTTSCGVLRGSARPALGAKINLGSFYGVGFPFALLMSFGLKMGLLGLWLGLLSAQFVCALIMALVLMRTDWVMEANRAKKLVGVN